MSAPSTLTSQREAAALKRFISTRLREQMERCGMSRVALARELGTSRSAVDRLLDPENTSITLLTLVRAAWTMGYRVHLRMAPRGDRPRRIRKLTRMEATLARLLDKGPAF